MLAMVMMCYCMLFNFLLWLGSEMNELEDYLTSELSGGLCCNGDRCHLGDAYLWQLWTRNSSTPMFDTARESLNMKYDDCSQTESVVHAVYWSFMVAGTIVAILHVISVLNMVTCYRKHMLRFYRGDFQFLSKFEPGPYVALTDALKYSSYQVIFTVAGWCFGTILLAMLFGFVSMVLILPHMVDVDVGTDAFFPWVWNTFLLDNENDKIGILTLCLILYGFLMGMVWFVFLDHKVHMAIRNRPLWDVFDLFQTVTNFIVGFFVFLRRLLTLIIFGFLFISRLDKPLVPRGYEWIDPGFATYQGFLFVEMYYSNPVMLTFIQFLIEEHTDKDGVRSPGDDDVALLGDSLAGIAAAPRDIAMKQRNVTKAKKMWWLLYTLIKNPELTVYRAHRGTWCAKKHRYSLRPRGDSLAQDSQSEFYEAIARRQSMEKQATLRRVSEGQVVGNSTPNPSPLRQVVTRRDHTLLVPPSVLFTDAGPAPTVTRSVSSVN